MYIDCLEISILGPPICNQLNLAVDCAYIEINIFMFYPILLFLLKLLFENNSFFFFSVHAYLYLSAVIAVGICQLIL